MNMGIFRNITKRTEAEKRLREKNYRMELLFKTARSLTETLNIEEVLTRIGNGAMEILTANACAIYLLEKCEKILKPVVAIDPKYEKQVLSTCLSIDSSLTGKAVKAKRALIFNDADSNSDAQQIPGTPKEKGEHIIVAPLINDDTVLGAMCLDRFISDFDNEDLTIAETFAAFAATVLKNAQTHFNLQREFEERKQAEKALRIGKAYFEKLFESSPEAIVMTDTCGNIMRTNMKFSELFGYNCKDVAAKNIDDLIAPRPFNTESRKITEEVLRGKTVSAEAIRYRKNSTPVYVSILASPIIVDGKQVALYAIFRDITKRKKSEEKLQQYANDLEQSNNEIKQFAYIVSHDLRSPLINLKGFASELQNSIQAMQPVIEAAIPYLESEQKNIISTTLNQDIPEALGFINASVTRMDNFINAILKLSRVGRCPMNMQAIDMNHIVKNVLQSLAHQIAEKNVTMVVDSLPHIVADRTSMEQVMGNILTNAILYLSPDRSGKIKVQAEKCGNGTLFSITDNGRGIRGKNMNKVFAPFRRTGKGDKPGEGMGLSYVQILIRRHGGRIWCDSVFGAGTTFSFTIPDNLEKGGNDE